MFIFIDSNYKKLCSLVETEGTQSSQLLEGLAITDHVVNIMYINLSFYPLFTILKLEECMCNVCYDYDKKNVQIFTPHNQCQIPGVSVPEPPLGQAVLNSI